MSYPYKVMGLSHGMWQKVLGDPFHSEGDQYLNFTIQVTSNQTCIDKKNAVLWGDY